MITLNIIDQCSMNGADPKSEQSVMATNTDVEMSEPVAVKTTIEVKILVLYYHGWLGLTSKGENLQEALHV